MEYKAEDFISFIENNRRDKISPNGLELIAKRFRELECEVNKLSLGAVSGRSGLLVSFLKWYVKDEMMRKEKELITSIVERYLNENNSH